ncbi:MAG: BolA family transcriptional regulator [Rubrivivax sp.]|jgi:BolA protein|nr:BolA family transcriptional regulator [Rubrivivax sp.]
MNDSVPRPGAAAIESRLREALAPAAVEVSDDSHRHAGHAGAREGGHYSVLVRSARFAGLSRVQRHRLVYDALGPWMRQGIHALAIDARSTDEP